MRRRYLVWALLIAVVVGFPYAYGAWERSKVGECTRQIQPAFARPANSSPAYVGEICFLGSSEFGLLFRLYDARGGELIAERLYYDTDVDMVWGSNKVWYSPHEHVSLPPTMWDRFRAKLP